MTAQDLAERAAAAAAAQLVAQFAAAGLSASVGETAGTLEIRLAGHSAAEEFGSRTTAASPRARSVLVRVTQGSST